MPNGGPGVSTFYGNGAPLAAAVKTFFDSMKTRIPAGIVLSFDGSGEEINIPDAVLVGAWTDGVPWTVTGTGTGAWAAGVGASIEWTTGIVVAGHRLNGRTFFAPMNALSFGADGTIDVNPLAELRAAATALVGSTANGFVIYSRPKPARAGKNGPLPQQDGAIGVVSGSVVKDIVSSLRSRRT
jgi:hypothetical protein